MAATNLPDVMTMRFAADTFDAIDAAKQDDETRSEFIRRAVSALVAASKRKPAPLRAAAD